MRVFSVSSAFFLDECGLVIRLLCSDLLALVVLKLGTLVSVFGYLSEHSVTVLGVYRLFLSVDWLLVTHAATQNGMYKLPGWLSCT